MGLELNLEVLLWSPHDETCDEPNLRKRNNTNFGPVFGPLWPKVALPKLFSWILSLLDVIHCCKLLLYAISKKTHEPNLRKWQKLSFGANFGPFSTNLGPKTFFQRFYLYNMLEIVARYHCMQFQRKQMNETWENDKKLTFGPNFGAFVQNLGCQNFFSKIWLCQSLDFMVTYYYVQYQKKLMMQSSKNLVTDGQTDKSDFIGRCPTNIERPKTSIRNIK